MKDHDIDANCASLYSARRERSYRDHLDYKDLWFAREATRAAVRNRRQTGPDAISLIEWPDGAKVRTFALPDPVDELVTRIAVGHFVSTIDRSLLGGVVSSRMKSPPPGWILENKKAAYRRRDRTAEGLIKEFNPQAALVSDIRAYYANVDVPRLGERLLALGCPGVDVATVRLFLSAWRDEQGLSGLPIGPEVSGPLGNAYLIEVDEHIESAQAKVIRFTDDYVILDLESRHESDLIRLFDQALTPAGLTRASDKTFWFSNAELAVEHHRHELIAYLAGGGGVVSKLEARKLLQAALEDDSLDPRLIKFLLGRFISSEDPFAARLVLSDDRIWSLDPLRCGEYMALILARHRIKDADHLLDGIQDQRDMDSIALCRLRAARSKARGRAEGRLFQSVSGNTQRHELVRAEAAGASALTPMWNSNDAVDQAVSSIVPIQVRRALTGAFHLFPSNPADARGLKRIAKSHDSLNITAFWAGGSS